MRVPEIIKRWLGITSPSLEFVKLFELVMQEAMLQFTAYIDDLADSIDAMEDE